MQWFFLQPLIFPSHTCTDWPSVNLEKTLLHIFRTFSLYVQLQYSALPWPPSTQNLSSEFKEDHHTSDAPPGSSGWNISGILICLSSFKNDSCVIHCLRSEISCFKCVVHFSYLRQEGDSALYNSIISRSLSLTYVSLRSFLPEE